MLRTKSQQFNTSYETLNDLLPPGPSPSLFGNLKRSPSDSLAEPLSSGPVSTVSTLSTEVEQRPVPMERERPSLRHSKSTPLMTLHQKAKTFENIHKLLELEIKVVGSPLLQNNRVYIRQDPAMMVFPTVNITQKLEPILILLFNDLLILWKTKTENIQISFNSLQIQKRPRELILNNNEIHFQTIEKKQDFENTLELLVENHKQSLVLKNKESLHRIMDWVPDWAAKECMLCQTSFWLLFRRHHCRCCGIVVCSKCSRFSMFGSRQVRVCLTCDSL